METVLKPIAFIFCRTSRHRAGLGSRNGCISPDQTKVRRPSMIIEYWSKAMECGALAAALIIVAGVAATFVTVAALAGGVASDGAEANPMPRTATADAARKALTLSRCIDTC